MYSSILVCQTRKETVQIERSRKDQQVDTHVSIPFPVLHSVDETILFSETPMLLHRSTREKLSVS